MDARTLNGAEKRKKGQAMTEMVLVFPIFVIVMMAVLKLFGLVLIVQKAEIASVYAARKWMLEAHRNANYYNWDDNLRDRIQEKVISFVGDSSLTPVDKTEVKITRTQVWSMIEVSVTLKPVNVPLLCLYPASAVCGSYGDACVRGHGFVCGGEGATPTVVRATKYVPIRDRPIAWSLPSV